MKALRALPFLLATVLVGCVETTRPNDDDATLRLTAIVSGTSVDLLVVTVTASDIPVPLVFNIPVVNGTASGTLHIPPGLARTIFVEAFDDQGEVTHDGSATVDVHRGQNPPVSILLRPRSGQVPIVVTIADILVVVDPSNVNMTVGDALQLTATILGPNNEVLQGTFTWATTNPVRAKVDQNGLVTALAPGDVMIVAVSDGVAGVSHIHISSTGTGGIQGTALEDDGVPLGAWPVRLELQGIVVASVGTDGNGHFEFAGLAPGVYTVVLAQLPVGCVNPGPQDVTVVVDQVAAADFVVPCGQAQGSLIISEFMANPNAVPDANGEWVELYNATNDPINLEGWTLRDAGGDVHIINTNGVGLVILPSSFLVLGIDAQPNTNGGVPVAYQYATFLLSNVADEIILVAPNGTEVDRVFYAVPPWPVVAGRSTSLDPSKFSVTLNDDPASWCESTTPFGGGGDLGTPGFANDQCGTQPGTAVNETGLPVEADYCVLQFPPAATIVLGASLNIFGQLFEAGLTDQFVGPHPVVMAAAGLGPQGTDPRTAQGWVFVPANFNIDVGNNDEYVAVLQPTVAGTFSTAYRFSVDLGATWTYCDVNGAGSNPGLILEINQLGSLTVTPGGGSPPVIVDVQPPQLNLFNPPVQALVAVTIGPVQNVDTQIQISVSGPPIIIAPPSVTVLAGQTTVQFQITALSPGQTVLELMLNGSIRSIPVMVN